MVKDESPTPKPNRTFSECLEAVKSNGLLIRSLKTQHLSPAEIEDLRVAAVQQNPKVLEMLTNPSKSVQQAAVLAKLKQGK